jgi:hypothetical protein
VGIDPMRSSLPTSTIGYHSREVILGHPVGEPPGLRKAIGLWSTRGE